ncbi:cobalt/nickel transport system ATP-binding protein [Cohaesibacter marisflavi]|uniref:Cobalt/nickel transport system ATP-binding protein n=1 Tax=Cohaesibacter marisflavi TaxID=655353 RepID=A0A1I5ASE5_9HYPH|nr:ABC transporter ATP-binding protein [Cohaesibacter marisflavi]SFN65099.1 cobalt/nickel transport system ATP-binding protein [Cohaesibacter marisflavi]
MSLLLETDKLSYAYHGSAPCLSGASLALEEGERVGLVGDNGVGKSTFLQVLVGLYKSHDGRITAFGQDFVTEEDFIQLRRRVGLVFQDPDDQLFCPTVKEDIAFGPLNLGYSRAEADAIVEETLALLNLSHLKERVTHRLSGGQKRLVALATVIAMKPDILLLDEPTNDLDEKTRIRLIEILLSLPQAMIIVSHDRAFREKVVTRTVKMENGQIF